MGAATPTQPIVFGKYLLLEKIATGGMAEIYRARYSAAGGFEKTLVIKKILPQLASDEDFLEMFHDEARLTVRLNHANIVQVFDFGRQGEDYFLAMEYVRGQTLRAILRRCQENGVAVPPAFAVFAVIEIAKGLAHAHSRRDDADSPMEIVHRDITPSNILVSYEGEVKITDFGIAKAASRAGGTDAGVVKGKTAYLAPEQIKGEAVDARADLFSLGAMTWELLVGRRLFTGDSDYEILKKIVEEPIKLPSSQNRSVPPEADALVMKALERDPGRRYASAVAMQKDLAVLLQHLGGAINPADISSFMRRLFRKELAAERAEKEKSRSYSLPVDVIDAAKVAAGAADGGSLVADSVPKPASQPRKRVLLATLGLGALLLLIAALWAARSYPPCFVGLCSRSNGEKLAPLLGEP